MGIPEEENNSLQRDSLATQLMQQMPSRSRRSVRAYAGHSDRGVRWRNSSYSGVDGILRKVAGDGGQAPWSSTPDPLLR